MKFGKNSLFLRQAKNALVIGDEEDIS